MPPRREPPWRDGSEQVLELLRQLEVLAALSRREAEGAGAVLLRRGAGRLCRALGRVAGDALALLLLLRLLLRAGALAGTGHARHPGRHAGDAAALGHLLHHLAGVEEPVDEAVDVLDLRAGALGDPQAARAVDHLG